MVVRTVGAPPPPPPPPPGCAETWSPRRARARPMDVKSAQAAAADEFLGQFVQLFGEVGSLWSWSKPVGNTSPLAPTTKSATRRRRAPILARDFATDDTHATALSALADARVPTRDNRPSSSLHSGPIQSE